MTKLAEVHALNLKPARLGAWFVLSTIGLGLIGLVLVSFGITLQDEGPLTEAAKVANQIAIMADRSQVVIQQSAQAALKAQEAVAQARAAYGTFSSEIAPSLGQGLGSIIATSQRFGGTLSAVAGHLDIPVPGGLDWKSWTTIPGLLYAHPLRPAADAFAAGGQDFTALAQGLQATQTVLRNQGAASERVTPALIEVERLLGDLGRLHLPALDQSVAAISAGATRASHGFTAPGTIVLFIGLGFIATACMGWRLGRQLTAMARASGVSTPLPIGIPAKIT